MIAGVIFDLDGLLADTESLHLMAYQQILGDYGMEIGEEEYSAWWIRDGRGIRDYVAAKNLPFDPDEIRRKKTAVYDRLVAEKAEPMPGAIDILKRVRPHKRLALATSSYAQSVRVVLGRLGIEQYFEVISTRESAKKAKPSPDVFLHAATGLGLPPEQCLVLEDAEKGVIAAADAGMKCIAVPNQFTRGSDFSRATKVVASLNEITLELIDSLG